SPSPAVTCEADISRSPSACSISTCRILLFRILSRCSSPILMVRLRGFVPSAIAWHLVILRQIEAGEFHAHVAIAQHALSQATYDQRKNACLLEHFERVGEVLRQVVCLDESFLDEFVPGHVRFSR